MLAVMTDERIDHRYAELIKNIHKHATARESLHWNTRKFKVTRGVRQGYTRSTQGKDTTHFTMAFRIRSI